MFIVLQLYSCDRTFKMHTTRTIILAIMSSKFDLVVSKDHLIIFLNPAELYRAANIFFLAPC